MAAQKKTLYLHSFERLPAQEIWGRRDNSRQLELCRSFLKESLSQLTPLEKRHIELYYFKGLKCREIAELLGTGVPTVSRNLARARRKLSSLAGIGERAGVFDAHSVE